VVSGVGYRAAVVPPQVSSDPERLTAPRRRRAVPTRIFGQKLIVARPRDGAPVVLEVTAVAVWQMLDGWITDDEIDRRLGRAFPDVTLQERQSARAAILDALEADDLIE
jgi:hypothetical protein